MQTHQRIREQGRLERCETRHHTWDTLRDEAAQESRGQILKGLEWHSKEVEPSRVGAGEPPKVSEQGRPVTVVW